VSRQQQLSFLDPPGCAGAWERLAEHRRREAIDMWARLTLLSARGREGPGKPAKAGPATPAEDVR